jgi:hypothetical protein
VLPQIILGAVAALAFAVCASSATVAILSQTKPAQRRAALQVFRIAWLSFVASAAIGALQLYANGLRQADRPIHR